MMRTRRFGAILQHRQRDSASAWLLLEVWRTNLWGSDRGRSCATGIGDGRSLRTGPSSQMLEARSMEGHQMRPPRLSARIHDRVRRQRRRRGVRPDLEALEGRIVLSLVAASNADTQLNTVAAFDQTEPKVAMDASGDYVVVWNRAFRIGPQLRLRCRGPHLRRGHQDVVVEPDHHRLGSGLRHQTLGGDGRQRRFRRGLAGVRSQRRTPQLPRRIRPDRGPEVQPRGGRPVHQPDHHRLQHCAEKPGFVAPGRDGSRR